MVLSALGDEVVGEGDEVLVAQAALRFAELAAGRDAGLELAGERGVASALQERLQHARTAKGLGRVAAQDRMGAFPYLVDDRVVGEAVQGGEVVEDAVPA